MNAASLDALFVGQDTLLMECVRAWETRGHRVAGVLTDTPRIRSWAESRSYPCFASRGLSVSSLPSADYLLSVTHLEIIEEPLLRHPRVGAVNFHDGPLPQYAGLNTPVWGLLNGERNWGIRWHWMATQVDAGQVIKAADFPLDADETALSLNMKNFGAGLDAFRELVPLLEKADPAQIPSFRPEGERRVYKRKDRPSRAGILDFRRSAPDLVREVRALDFGPYPNPMAAPKILVGHDALWVTRAEVLDGKDGAVPGQVLAVDEDGITVACNDSSVRLLGLHRLDGQPVEAGDLRRGLGLGPGDRLPQVDVPPDFGPSFGRNEAEWSRLLADAPELPVELASSGPAVGSQDLYPTGQEFSLQGPTGLSTQAWAGAWAAFWSQVAEGTANVGVPFRWQGASELRSAVLEWVPVRLTPKPGDRLSDVTESFQAARQAAVDRGPMLRELAARTGSPRRGGSGNPFQVGLADGRPWPSHAPDLVLDPHGPTLHAGPDVVGARVWKERFEAFLEVFGTDAVPVGACLPWSHGERDQLDGWERGMSEREDPSQRPSRGPGVEGFFTQAQRTPDREALRTPEGPITYQELRGQVWALAARLKEAGMGSGSRVGVHLPRGAASVVAPLAVMSVGAAYVPLDPEYPAERLRFMAQDAGLDGICVASGAKPSFAENLPVFSVENLPALKEDPQLPAPGPRDLAYVIYTSGSTGLPKGVKVTHENVAHFFSSMDAVVPREEAGQEVWLSVTSLSFDISVLELFWTLSRGFTVVLRGAARATPTVRFGMFMWGNDDGPGPDKYRLMLEAAEYLDARGFDSVWTPERHFHAFGGPYPNPSVTSAALAVRTRRMSIRAGSCVSPLHHPLRIAEEWSVVDNLSNGRVGISFAAGWQPDDFILQPTSFGRAKERMFEQIEEVRALWRGEALPFEHPMGKTMELRSLPRPVQAELPVWVTAAGSPETFRKAGEIGANLLTHLLGQSAEELEKKIQVYREARAAAGHDPGTVTLMLHSLIGPDRASVRARVRKPLKDYLLSSLRLLQAYAWTFPAFKKTNEGEVDLDALSPEEVDAMMEHAFERYFETSGLFGSVEEGAARVRSLSAIGVDEVACLLDFGVPTEQVLESLPYLVRVKDAVREADDDDLRGLVQRHGVTHVQCTPSLARLALELDRRALDDIPHLFLGGEPFPPSLAERVAQRPGRKTVFNLYGPTETTVWCASQKVWAQDGTGLPEGFGGRAQIPIGRPLPHCRVRVARPDGRPAAPGQEGELWVAGPHVTAGYHERPELTAERFVHLEGTEDASTVWYRTGDRGRFDEAGRLVHLGRDDGQVKIRGHRVELGEVEAALCRLPQVTMAVAVVHQDALHAFVQGPLNLNESDVKEALRSRLPPAWVPSRVHAVDEFPLTPNGKVDRKALLNPVRTQVSEPAVEIPSPHNPAAPKLGAAGDLRAVTEKMRAIWAQVLGRPVEGVGLKDNFFDLGGHSLSVVQVHQALKKQIHEGVSLTDLYRFPTLETLGQHLCGATDGDPASDPDTPAPAVAAAASRAERRKRARRGQRP